MIRSYSTFHSYWQIKTSLTCAVLCKNGKLTIFIFWVLIGWSCLHIFSFKLHDYLIVHYIQIARTYVLSCTFVLQIALQTVYSFIQFFHVKLIKKIIIMRKKRNLNLNIDSEYPRIDFTNPEIDGIPNPRIGTAVFWFT